MKNDYVSGSLKLLMESLIQLKTLPENAREDAMKQTADNMRGMIVFNNALAFFEKNGFSDSSMEQYSDFIENDIRNTVRSVRSILSDFSNVLTISNSSTVLSALNEYNGEVFALRSQPQREGEIFCKMLKDKDVSCKIIEDRQFRRYYDSNTVFLCGCDGYDDNYFINKKGTSPITGFASQNHRDAFILCGEAKYTNDLRLFTMPPDFELIARKDITII